MFNEDARADLAKRYNQRVLENLPAILGFLTGRTQLLAAMDGQPITHTETRYRPNGNPYTYHFTPERLQADLESCRIHYKGVKAAIASGNGRDGKKHVMEWQTILRRWGWCTGKMVWVLFKESYNNHAGAYALIAVKWGLKNYKPPQIPDWVKELQVNTPQEKTDVVQ